SRAVRWRSDSRRYRCRRIPVHGLSGGKTDRHWIAKKTEAIDCATDFVGIAPCESAVESLAAGSALKICVPPAANPAVTGLQETYSFKVRVTLRVIHRVPPPRQTTVCRLQDRAFFEVLQRDESGSIIQELNFPAPLPIWKNGYGSRDLVDRS